LNIITLCANARARVRTHRTHDVEYSRNPLIQTLVIQIANYPDRQLSASPIIRIANYPDRQLSGSPIIRIANYPERQLSGSPIIRIAIYPDRLGPSGKFVENFTKLTCLEITGYRIKYNAVLWLLELQIRRGRNV
jgi:hypothetical protein